ncbi:MAG TPA: cbb3-type cytochrome c oxidase N-terminal domain-containing protein [Kiritimatiellia bacterium]|mgnify:CR=1 FL=1|nr:cbb3-type cytochrome c oxidase N-terminal domain-containing protein [Kiritimatiellia bacterium]
MSHEENPMAGHEVDGISELDNRLPRWWVWLFNITIIFSVIYMLYFHVFNVGDLQAAQYEREMARARGAVESAVVVADVSENEPSTDPKVLARGKALFNANCVVCHAADGGGGIGPNLTDDYYIHGSTFADELHVIREGVPAKGMIAWKTQLRPADIHAVASFIYTLRGTTPLQAKAPEGVKKEG